ncbi:MAG: hypothetical protein WDW36_000033 [Sanguina aurantia]
MATDAYSLLTGGARFDTKRFKREFELFHAVPVPGQAAAVAAQPSLLHQGDTESTGQPSKKQRRREASAAAAGNDPSIQMFSSGGAAAGETHSSVNLKHAASAGKHKQHQEADSEDAEEDGDGDEQTGSEEAPEGQRHVCSSSSRGGEDGASGSSGQDRQSRPESGASASCRSLADPSCPVLDSKDVNEEANVIRKAFKIKVTGGEPPCPLRSFAEMGVRFKAAKKLLANITAGGYGEPTPIQRQAIPALLGGRELLAVAPTGSGKTLAFLLPILIRLRWLRLHGDWAPGVKAVILSPTHELACQQARSLKQLLPGAKLSACLLSKSTAAGSNFDKVDVLLANPLRLATMVEGKKIVLANVRFLVLDEADKLFELGFMEQIDGVLAACTHPQLSRALFSATLPETVEAMARTVLQQPLRITVGLKNAPATTVKQTLLFAGREAGKLLALRQLVQKGLTPPVLVFVGSKLRAKELHRELMYDGVHVDSITADQTATARSAAIDNFRSGKTWVLIATDLIGRGMDFIGVNTVVNYDFPHSTVDYIHRIGRTGRAGKTGEAITFFTEEDSGLLKPIANQIKAAGGEVPEWMLHLKRRKWLPPAERGHSFNKDKKDGEADAEPAASAAPSTKQQRQQNRGKLGKKGAGKDKQDASDGETAGRVAVVGKEKEAAGGGAVKARPAKLHGGISTLPRFDVQQRRKKQEMVEASKRKKAKGL